ncbi:putative ABC-type transport system, periplasmic component/surface lipoprotein [Leptolyngbyaceae cyanobacterium JSC-12]|nr:putative ABC-type transport system, periplasmic component/surface lipoprotein [Leptolyngbyaceae cyanobacterium JSC-12]
MGSCFVLRRFQSTVLGLMLVIPLATLAGCTGQQTSQPVASPITNQPGSSGTNATAKRLAVVLPGVPNDQSWDQAAYDAAQALKAKGVDVVVAEAVSPADAPRVLRQYADAGYTTIVAHSFNFQDAVFQVAKEYPNINFAWAGGIQRTGANVADYDQPFYQGAYLVGLVAAKLSKTGKLGAVHGFDIPVCHAMGKAMLAGAKKMRPDAKLVASAAGDWYDVAKAKEAAIAQAETGVDFWIGCGTGPVLGAIQAANTKGGYVTSYVGDMSSQGPKVVAANLIWNLEPLFTKMLEDTAAKTFANKFYQLAIPEDVIQVEVTPAFKDKVGADTIKQMEETRSKIASGEIKVPFVPK